MGGFARKIKIVSALKLQGALSVEMVPHCLKGRGRHRVPFILMENSPSRFSSSASMVHIFCDENRKLASAQDFGHQQLKARDIRAANRQLRLEVLNTRGH